VSYIFGLTLRSGHVGWASRIASGHHLPIATPSTNGVCQVFFGVCQGNFSVFQPIDGVFHLSDGVFVLKNGVCRGKIGCRWVSDGVFGEKFGVCDS